MCFYGRIWKPIFCRAILLMEWRRRRRKVLFCLWCALRMIRCMTPIAKCSIKLPRGSFFAVRTRRKKICSFAWSILKRRKTIFSKLSISLKCRAWSACAFPMRWFLLTACRSSLSNARVLRARMRPFSMRMSSWRCAIPAIFPIYSNTMRLLWSATVSIINTVLYLPITIIFTLGAKSRTMKRKWTASTPYIRWWKGCSVKTDCFPSSKTLFSSPINRKTN